MSRKYNIIISIGEDCACSTYLRKNKLQFLSLPFDWLTNATLETRLNLILNDFNNFLNISDLKYLAKDSNMANDSENDYYENLKTGFYHYHDFPSNKNFQDIFDEVKAKYDRRIERFYHQVKVSKKVLLVWLSHSKNNEDSLIKNKHFELCKKFGKNIDLLIIENDKSKKGTDLIEEFRISENIVRYALDTASFEISKDQTMGNIRNCNKIFAKYQLKFAFLFNIKNKFRKLLTKLMKRIKKNSYVSQN